MYRALISQMADAEPAERRERSPHRGDRRPLAVQRAEQDAMLAKREKRASAMAHRNKTIPPAAAKPAAKPPSEPPAAKPAATKTPAIRPSKPAPMRKSKEKKPQQSVSVAASSSSHPPPPPPGAGGVKQAVQHFNINRKPRPQIATRPLVPTPNVSGVKRKAEEDGGVRGRPKQPPAPDPARGAKRPGGHMDDMQMPPKTPRRNQKGTKVAWTQPRANTKWSKTVVR